MKRKKLRKRITSQLSFAKYFVLIGILSFSIMAIGLALLFPKKTTLHTLASLPIPTQRPEVYLPGPYEAAIITSPVLGADTVDPRDVITYINNERMKVGSPPLRTNKLLSIAAQKRADVILKYQNFSHHDPHEHIQLDTVLPMVSYPFRFATENIGMGDSSAYGFVNGFMSSPSHKANLLNPELEETGVAIVTGAYQQYYVNIAVQLFAIPATKEQYLGYTDEDRENYKKLLEDIEKQLALTRDRLSNGVSDADYYEGWQKILIRQKEIVTLLYNTTLQNQPMVKNLVTLIGEYNRNWSLVPKSGS
jgi:uncharacterized protein YkwD